jgi:hypothetical protein
MILNLLPEDPVLSTPRQNPRLEKNFFLYEIESKEALSGNIFFPSNGLCPGVLKTGSSGR